MLSAAASRMICLLLSSPPANNFWSGASSKDSLNLLNGFPSLACTVLDHCEMQEFLLQLMGNLTWDDGEWRHTLSTEPCRIRAGWMESMAMQCLQADVSPVWPGLKPALD